MSTLDLLLNYNMFFTLHLTAEIVYCILFMVDANAIVAVENAIRVLQIHSDVVPFRP